MMEENRKGQKLGAYLLVDLLGKGGFSNVYLGQHLYIDEQLVAIKVVDQQYTQQKLEDFKKEAQLLGQLIHHHIVRVLEFGIDEKAGAYYLVMEYAPHGSLRQRHPYGTRVPLARILTYVKQIALALEYIHNKGIVHCDVKPDNMLLGYNQDVLLSDFGIAIAVQNQRRLELIGTPEYMSPEQFSHKPTAVSDQYSLGIVIYEWLCGSCPFTGASISELIAQHRSIPPIPLSERVPGIPPAVEQVVMRALEKFPARRYKSIQGFAEAFEQACLAAAVPTTEELSPYSVTELLPTDHVTQLVPLPPPTVRLAPTPSTIRVHHTFPTRVLEPVTGLCLYTHIGHSDFVRAVAWSPNGKRIASASDDWTVQIWDAMSRANASTYDQHRDQVWSVVWLSDSRSIVSGSARQEAHIWDADTGETLQTYEGHSKSALNLGVVYMVAWSPDQRYIASGGAGYTIHIWNKETGAYVSSYGGHFGDVNSISWSPSPDESYIASGSSDRTVQVWNATTGNTVFEYRGLSRVRSIAWSPDGRRLASASEDGIVRVLDVSTGQNTLIYRNHSKRLRAVAWSPDGTRIASAGDERTIQVWDVSTEKVLFICEGHEAAVNAVAWSPDGQYLVSASGDMTVKVWQAK